jgi:hypothetical protein
MINESEEVVVLLTENEPDKRLNFGHDKRLKPIMNNPTLSALMIAMTCHAL